MNEEFEQRDQFGAEPIKTELPEIFYSDGTGKPFTNCLMCEKDLLNPDTFYVIEKAIKHYKSLNTTDTVYEYAMCFDCYMEMQKSLSKTSQQRMEEYMMQYMDLFQRRDMLMQKGEPQLDDWLGACIVKGTKLEECSEYQIMCECSGKDMLFTLSPLMISGEAIDEIAHLLSNETLGEIGRFKETYFDIPPELKINPTKPDLVIL